MFIGAVDRFLEAFIFSLHTEEMTSLFSKIKSLHRKAEVADRSEAKGDGVDRNAVWRFCFHGCSVFIYLYRTYPVEREISRHRFLQKKNTSRVIGDGCLCVQTSTDLSRAKVDG